MEYKILDKKTVMEDDICHKVVCDKEFDIKNQHEFKYFYPRYQYYLFEMLAPNLVSFTNIIGSNNKFKLQIKQAALINKDKREEKIVVALVCCIFILYFYNILIYII